MDSHKENGQPSARQQIIKKRKRNRDAREINADLKCQRDAAVGLLADANLRIAELTEELSLAAMRYEELRPSAAVVTLPTRRQLADPI